MSSSFVMPWSVAHQAPQSMGFPRQEYWNSLPLPIPRGFPDPEIEPKSSALVGGCFTTEPPGKPISLYFIFFLQYFLEQASLHSRRQVRVMIL